MSEIAVGAPIPKTIVNKITPNIHKKLPHKVVREKEEKGGSSDRGHFHWLADADRESIDEIVKIHRRIRRLVREEAGELG